MHPLRGSGRCQTLRLCGLRIRGYGRSQSSSLGPCTMVEGSFENSLSRFSAVAWGLSLGIRSIAMWSRVSSSDATAHASISFSLGLIPLDIGETSNGIGSWSPSTVWSVLTSGAWIRAGADTRGGLGAALALKNEWSVRFGFASGLGQVHAFCLSCSAWQGFDARWMSRFLCPPVPTRMSLPQSGHGSVLSAVNSPVVLKDRVTSTSASTCRRSLFFLRHFQQLRRLVQIFY